MGGENQRGKEGKQRTKKKKKRKWEKKKGGRAEDLEEGRIVYSIAIAFTSHGISCKFPGVFA